MRLGPSPQRIKTIFWRDEGAFLFLKRWFHTRIIHDMAMYVKPLSVRRRAISSPASKSGVFMTLFYKYLLFANE